MRKTWALGLAAALLALPGCGSGNRMGNSGAVGSGYMSSDMGSYSGNYDNYAGNYSGNYANGGTFDTYADGSAYGTGNTLTEQAGDALRRGTNDVRNGLDRAGDALRDTVDNSRTDNMAR